MALLLGVVREVPRLNGRRVVGFELTTELLELFILTLEGGQRLAPEVVYEGLRFGAFFGHSIFGDQIREISVAEKLSFRAP